MGKRDIYVVDSKSAACGETQIVYKIMELEEKGLAFVEITEQIERFVKDMNTYFVLENLDTLRKNGRLSGVKALVDTDFYKKQHRVALRNCGVINPEVIDEYIGTGGYEALGKVLTEMTPDDVIQVLLDSGLRGRGGRRLPHRLKMEAGQAE